MTPLLLSFFFLFLGFLLLYLGGEILVKSSISLAIKMNISSLIIGMTIVSFATSLPEIFVSVQALLEGSTNIALGNVIGSNIANLSLVLGVTAFLVRLKISNQTSRIDYPFLLFISLLLGLFLFLFSEINVIVGLFFLVLLCLFLYHLIKKKNNNYVLQDSNETISSSKDISVFKNVIYLFLGILLLHFGADILVKGTIQIANKFGVSDRIIAVTIVAFGTSIPELVTSVVAALKKQQDLAIGNLIGSNIFNILAVLGFSSLIKEISINDQHIIYFDYVYMIIVTVLIGLFIYISSRKVIYQKQGIFLVLLYVMYICFNIIN